MRPFVFVAALAAGCGGGAATGDGPASMALVDLFGQESTVVSGSPTLSTPPRAAWRFADPAPAALPDAVAATLGWTSRGDVTDLAGPDDLHSVEIRLSVSAGENLEVTFQGSDAPDVDEVRSADWALDTPIIPGDELQTYTITNDGGTDTAGSCQRVR